MCDADNVSFIVDFECFVVDDNFSNFVRFSSFFFFLSCRNFLFRRFTMSESLDVTGPTSSSKCRSRPNTWSNIVFKWHKANETQNEWRNTKSRKTQKQKSFFFAVRFRMCDSCADQFSYLYLLFFLHLLASVDVASASPDSTSTFCSFIFHFWWLVWDCVCVCNNLRCVLLE